jgi:hypothetical protein
MELENIDLIREIISKRRIIMILKEHINSDRFNGAGLNNFADMSSGLIRTGDIRNKNGYKGYHTQYDESLKFVRELNNYEHFPYLRDFLLHESNKIYKNLFLCFSAFPEYPETIMCNKKSFDFIREIAG